MKIHVKGMDQIGDSIYVRPFLTRLLDQQHEVYLTTSYPKLYSDLEALKLTRPTEFTRRVAKLELLTQEPGVTFVNKPTDVDREIDFHYTAADLKQQGIFASIEKRFGFETGSTLEQLSLPELPRHRVNVTSERKLAVVRPVTHRREFPCVTRSPEPHYVAWCARVLREMGYFVVSLADLDDVEETLVGDPPPADLTLHRGELGLMGTLSLIRDAHVAVGGSGFIIPAALAAGTPLFTIFGGRGELDNPRTVFDLRVNLRRVGWAVPDNFCRCNRHEHDCNKKISNLDDKFFSFMRQLT